MSNDQEKALRCVMKRDREVIEYTRTRIKKFPNSPILRYNHELRSIVVNKVESTENQGIFEKLFEIRSNRTMN